VGLKAAPVYCQSNLLSPVVCWRRISAVQKFNLNLAL
jgi:hypothetical protein